MQRTARRGSARVWNSVSACVATCMAIAPLSLGGMPRALAAASCSFDGSTLAVTLPLLDDAARFQQGVGTDAGAILVNGSSCTPAATVATTDMIVVTGGPRDQAILIDLLDADLEPVSWGNIDWSVTLGTGDEDRGDLLRIDGAADLTMGTEGIDLETDGDLDVVFDRVEELLVAGTDDDDVVSATGDATTGDPLTQGVDVITYHGDDTLIGGNGDDFLDAFLSSGRGHKELDGGEGDDQLWGGRGADVIDGGDGQDILVGFRGDDTIQGSDGDDFARGGVGDDRLLGGTGDDVLKGELGSDALLGGPGDDRCRGGEGQDRILTCEAGTGSPSSGPRSLGPDRGWSLWGRPSQVAPAWIRCPRPRRCLLPQRCSVPTSGARRPTVTPQRPSSWA